MCLGRRTRFRAYCVRRLLLLRVTTNFGTERDFTFASRLTFLAGDGARGRKWKLTRDASSEERKCRRPAFPSSDKPR